MLPVRREWDDTIEAACERCRAPFAINDGGEYNVFANDPQVARTISVSWQAISMTLRDVYGAQSLLEEMTH